ncbi:hypothetical protein ACQ8FT_004049 [Yersinia enterocolitica]
METKFLSDGRKVVIVGQLNNQETIVHLPDSLGDQREVGFGMVNSWS